MFKICAYISLFLIVSCQGNSQDLKEIFSFPDNYKEISGIAFNNKNDLIYTLEDSGNTNELLVFDLKGNEKHKILIENVSNNDWEDLAIDVNFNLYIGDFGNNKNIRKNLAIYKIDTSYLSKKTVKSVQITNFSYPEQSKFPPKKKNLFFDCEAFVAIDSSFYLFTKNRSKDFDGTFYVYQIPNKNGTFKAKKIAELNSGNSYDSAVITGAAYNYQTKQIALTTHSKAILIAFENEESFNQNNLKFIDYNHNSQKEAITYKDENTLLIADERAKKDKQGGKIYELKLNN